MKTLIQTLFFCLMFTQISAQCQEQDYIALRALYLSTGGDSWTDNTGWLTEAEFITNPTMPAGTNVGTWYGVTTNVDGCVICIDMDGNDNCVINFGSGNNLSGSIPPELVDLDNLTYLLLGYNNLSGSIPPEIGNSNSLTELNLSSNLLSGNIPAELGNLSNLTELWLSSNDLIGSIPVELGNLSNLTGLRLNSNDLTGSIPAELGNLSNLIRLRLRNNDLIGSIPAELGNLSNLTELSLFNNNLSGSIPAELGNLSNLTELSLYYNNLSGSIPAELGNLSNLTGLRLNSNDLTGSIPAELGNLNNLTYLWLYSNNLSGCYDANLLVLCSQLIHFGSSGNADISNGNNFDAPWEAFCAIGVNACDISNVVLPGNFDNNAIVEGKDLLYWGLAYGYTGPPRDSATTDWIPQYNIKDWNDSIDGVNSKHQDANGDGIVDMLDLEILEDNYGENYGKNYGGKNYGINSLKYPATNAMFVIKELVVDTITDIITFELHIASDVPIIKHGISTKIDLSGIKNIYKVQVDTSDSSLHPDVYIDINNGDNIIDIALTRTDRIDQIIDGPVVSLVVITKDIQSGITISVNDGYAMSANDYGMLAKSYGMPDTGVLTSIGGCTAHVGLSEFVSLGVNDAYCDEMGSARIYMADTTNFSWLWSTGEINTTSIEGLDIGSYSVVVSDGIGTMTIDFDIGWALPPIDIDLHVWLEGAYNPDDEEMSTTLSELGLLPTEQPYHIAPWNYTGADWTDADSTSNETDWVLVSFRTDTHKNTEVGMAAGLLQKDGSITFPDRCILDSTITSPLYIVVEHRNHIGVMTPTPVDIVNGTLTHDFRAADSYDGEGTGSGQKQLPTGEWGMFAGDADQSDFPSYDISGSDKTMWVSNNGKFNYYISSDFNLDGGVDGADKIFWFENNGISSRVPR